MEFCLDQLCPGTWATVKDLNVSEELKQRLRDLGMIPGTKVCCRYRSPRGDVTALEFRGTVLALRTRDLRKIRVRRG